MWTPVNTSGTLSWPGVVTDPRLTYYLLQENGSLILQEDGGRIIQATPSPTWAQVATPATNPWAPV